MKKISILTIFTSLFFIGQVQAEYSIKWPSISHNSFEGGEKFNLVFFYIVDSNDNFIFDNIIDTVELYDPNYNYIEQDTNNHVIPKTNATWYSGWDQDTEIWGWYDAPSGKWFFSDPESPYQYAFYTYIFNDSIIEGVYRLKVVLQSGEILWREVEVDSSVFVELPFIPSESFFGYWDETDNFIWKWDVPTTVDPNIETRVSAIISIYEGKNWTGFVWLRMPTHVGTVIIPPDAMNWILSVGNRYDFNVRLETYGLNVVNRYRSHYASLEDLLSNNPSLVDTLHPTGAVHAYDNVLWHANKKMKRVTLAGYVKDEISIAHDGGGIGVSEAYILINGNRQIELSLDEFGNFSENVFLKAKKGRTYTIELYASDTNPDGPNSGLVDTTYVRVPHGMSGKDKNK